MKTVLVPALLCALAGQASLAQVTIDGRIQGPEASLYQQLWVQNQPTAFGDSAPFVGSAGDPENVVFGHEVRIPVSALGLGASVTEQVNLMAWLSDDVNVSNQIIGADALAPNSPALGNGSMLNFGTVPGIQFLSIVPSLVSTVPTMDGSLDGGLGGYWAGTRVWLNSNYSSMGDNTDPTPGGGNGSELDALYAVRYDNGTPADASDDVLYFFFAGNVHQGPKCNLVFDTVAGGQNVLLPGQPDQGFGYFQRLQGLTFDAGFAPDHFFVWNKFGGTTFMDYLSLPDGAPAAAGAYVGGIDSGEQPLTVDGMGNPIMGAGGGNTPAIALRYDNSNIIGVTGAPAGLVSPDRINAFGSEINNVSAYIDGGTLHLFVGGNLQTNFNSLVLFLDTSEFEGQNQLRGAADSPPNPFMDFNNLNRMGNGGNNPNNPSPGPGLKFDAGFSADYALRIAGNSTTICTNAAVIRTGGRLDNSGFQLEFSSFQCSPRAALANPVEVNDFPALYAQCQPFSNPEDPAETDGAPRRTTSDNDLLLAPCDANSNIPTAVLTPNLIRSALDNSNGAGVTDTTASSGAAGAVSSGVEIAIDLIEAGWDSESPIKIAGFITSSDYGFVSNQVLGGLPDPANLGEPAVIDFSLIAGDQFVVIPTGPGLPQCNSIDFNQDGLFPDDGDLIDFLNVSAGGTCSNDPNCDTTDFNNDGLFPDDQDLIDFLTVSAGGTPASCTP